MALRSRSTMARARGPGSSRVTSSGPFGFGLGDGLKGFLRGEDVSRDIFARARPRNKPRPPGNGRPAESARREPGEVAPAQRTTTKWALNSNPVGVVTRYM